MSKTLILPESTDTNEVSDGYHTFAELYEFRKLYHAVLVNTWHQNQQYKSYKSRRHSNGELCFGGGWFIVLTILPSGQISNHYEEKDWNLFNIPVVDIPPDVFDGHTAEDVLDRLRLLLWQHHP